MLVDSQTVKVHLFVIFVLSALATDKICWIELQQSDRLDKKLLHIDRVELTAGARL